MGFAAGFSVGFNAIEAAKRTAMLQQEAEERRTLAAEQRAERERERMVRAETAAAMAPQAAEAGFTVQGAESPFYRTDEGADQAAQMQRIRDHVPGTSSAVEPGAAAAPSAADVALDSAMPRTEPTAAPAARDLAAGVQPKAAFQVAGKQYADQGAADLAAQVGSGTSARMRRAAEVQARHGNVKESLALEAQAKQYANEGFAEALDVGMTTGDWNGQAKRLFNESGKIKIDGEIVAEPVDRKTPDGTVVRDFGLSLKNPDGTVRFLGSAIELRQKADGFKAWQEAQRAEAKDGREARTVGATERNAATNEVNVRNNAEEARERNRIAAEAQRVSAAAQRASAEYQRGMLGVAQQNADTNEDRIYAAAEAAANKAGKGKAGGLNAEAANSVRGTLKDLIADDDSGAPGAADGVTRMRTRAFDVAQSAANTNLGGANAELLNPMTLATIGAKVARGEDLARQLRAADKSITDEQVRDKVRAAGFDVPVQADDPKTGRRFWFVDVGGKPVIVRNEPLPSAKKDAGKKDGADKPAAAPATTNAAPRAAAPRPVQMAAAESTAPAPAATRPAEIATREQRQAASARVQARNAAATAPAAPADPDVAELVRQRDALRAQIAAARTPGERAMLIGQLGPIESRIASASR